MVDRSTENQLLFLVLPVEGKEQDTKEGNQQKYAYEILTSRFHPAQRTLRFASVFPVALSFILFLMLQ